MVAQMLDQRLLLTTACRVGPDEGLELVHIPRLHVDGARSNESAHKTLASLETAHATAALES